MQTHRTIISQLVYTFGGSGFAGANGSMMIEVVPFFHILASGIASEIGEDKPAEIISTTIAAFALSSILTGLTFFALGALRLGVVIGFFPRHILVGCIGGVGVFLIETGLAVCARIDDDEFEYNFETLKFFLGNAHTLALWLPAFLLAVLLRAITHRYHHQLIFPAYFLAIPAIFYIVVAIARIDIGTLRRTGWVFDMGSSSEPWYTFYSYYDLKKTSLKALWTTLPTQFALLFFNILHPPLNVPALAVSLNEDVDTNKELIAHGYSNLLAGAFGSVPNYLVYVNTLLFYRVGGGTRLAGFLLAVFTVFLLLLGTAPIGFIPIMVVGALIFVLGIDLVKEALWDTRRRVSRSEYITIASIMVCMTLWDFVIGVLFGIVVSCFFFVVQNSQSRSIRALYTGESAISAVRRPSAHREYIRAVAKQTMVLKLQGFLFFGTITGVEEAIRKLVELAEWQRNPIRFLIIDLSLVVGVDMSSAEAFVRVQRILAARSVTMVFSGFTVDSAVGIALQSVGLLEADYVEVFTAFTDAVEWTENAYLRAWFNSQKAEVDSTAKTYHAPPVRKKSAFALGESFANSPRRVQIFNAAGRTIAQGGPPTYRANTSFILFLDEAEYPFQDDTPDPFMTLTKAFSSYGELDRELFRPLVSYLKRMSVPEGLVLWQYGDESDGLYLIESGVLRASYKFTDHTDGFEESMVGGTLAGELSALSGLPRNATCTVERQAVLWKLSIEDLRRLEVDHPELARTFSTLILKAAKIDYDTLLSALAARQ
ncbi:sulfate anion transporter [Rickenella mellea]|uniref:Sulfate anion transporter n=1 Tax=Rickenella mellea TaxID=50990 RepID=A0A4Y7PMU6_9AGAM|nr:sulfate anion transporter [Rickenella mellea]